MNHSHKLKHKRIGEHIVRQEKTLNVNRQKTNMLLMGAKIRRQSQLTLQKKMHQVYQLQLAKHETPTLGKAIHMHTNIKKKIMNQQTK